MLESLIELSAKDFLHSICVAEFQHHFLMMECEKLNDRYIHNARYTYHQNMMIMYTNLFNKFLNNDYNFIEQ